MNPANFRFPLFALVALIAKSGAAAQQDLPVLRSHTKTLTIIDGDHVKTSYWAVMPAKNPDVYYVEIPRKSHTVTFRSDIDELSFPVQYGDRIDFVVLLDDETRCVTQIRAEYRQLQSLTLKPEMAAAEIPFTLGDNDKIYVRGQLNGSPELSFQLDLGCGGSIIKKGSVPLVKMRFDGTLTLSNSDGVHEVPTSSDNQLQLGAMHWRDLTFAVADNMTHREDGLLGNILFQDKIVEINYDRRVIVIYDSLPAIDPAYSKHAILLDCVVPFIHGALEIGGERREGWFMFDTGAYTSILTTDRATPWSKLLAELKKSVWLSEQQAPRLAIGEHSFADFNYTVKNESRGDQLGLLGNDLLKRFNVILDNREGFVYLSPNSHASEPYRNPEWYLARGILLGGVCLLAGGLVAVRRRRLRKMALRQNLWVK